MRDVRTEQLLLQYEDAALGLLMEDYADTEGARVLQAFEAASRQGEIVPLPEDVDAKCLQLIDRAYAKTRRQEAVSKLLRTTGAVLAAVLVLFSLASITVLSVEALRVPVLNFILSKTNRYTSLQLNSGDTPSQAHDGIADLVAALIPSDYRLVNQSDPDTDMLHLRYANEEGKLILVVVEPASAAILIDTENTQMIEMEVGEHTAFLMQKDGLHILWHDEEAALIYQVFADGLPADDFWILIYGLAT